MTSEDIIRVAILTFLGRFPGFEGQLAVMFDQKYEHEKEKDWERIQTVADISWNKDAPVIEFYDDFCEGQTDVRRVTITPLDIVLNWFDIFP